MDGKAKGAYMTAPLYPKRGPVDREAGNVPPQKIADALGWPATQLARVAAKHGINLRAQIARRDDGATVLAMVGRAKLPDRRTEHFGVRLRQADAEIIRQTAAHRLTNPSQLLAEVIEGALLRGKVDELATASTRY
jgi:hypothetical protein